MATCVGTSSPCSEQTSETWIAFPSHAANTAQGLGAAASAAARRFMSASFSSFEVVRTTEQTFPPSPRPARKPRFRSSLQ